MPSRPHLLACRKTRFPITSNLGRFVTYKPLRRLTSEWCGAYICARFSPQFRCVSSLRANSPHPRLSVPQPKRNFSHTTRKDGSIWDEDDDQTPEPPTPQRIPGRPNRARPAVHRNVSDLVRARVDGAARIAQRKDIEKQLNYLVSSRQLMVGAFVQLKYQHIDDRISELINVNESLQAEWKTLSLTLEKRVSDMMSQITKKVLQAKRTTDECADELAILSERIITRHIEVIADARDRVLQAEKITQKYVQEVTHLSASILGLKRLQVAVMESDDVCRLIDHEFCRTVFARIPEWENKLKVFDQNMRQWEKLVRTARLKRLSEQVHYSERSIFRLRVALYEEYIAPRIKRLSKQVHNSERLISRLRETVHEEHLEPRKAARDRIDRVLAQSDLILEEYRKLRATHEQITFSHISKLCGDLSRSENIRPTDQYRFLVFANDISAGQADLYLRLHVYRSNWLQRQWDAHPLRQSEAWNLHGITNAVATRDLGDRSPHIIQQIALASPNKIGFIRRNALQLSHKFKSVYRPIWKQRPARSPELPMYWRQLDVLGPFYIVNFSSWLIGEEVHYLLASLKGQCGELWSWLPETTLAHSIDILHQWCTTDHARRSELRTELTKYRQLNWLRLRTETTLHSLGEPVYLAGKFEVRNPLSQDAQRFEVWSRTMGELITGAFVARLAQHTSVDQWNELYRKYELPGTTQSRILQLGSVKTRRERRRGLFRAPKPAVDVPAHRADPEINNNRVPQERRGVLGSTTEVRARQRASPLAANNGIQEESHVQHKQSTTPWRTARKFANGHQPESIHPATNQDGHEHSQAVRAPRAALWGRMRKSSNGQPESIQPTIDQDGPGRSRTVQAIRAALWPKMGLSLDGQPLSTHPNTNQDGHGHSRTVHAPRAAIWGRIKKSSNAQPDYIQPTTNQDGHEHSRAVRAPRAALWGRMRKSSNGQPESIQPTIDQDGPGRSRTVQAIRAALWPKMGLSLDGQPLSTHPNTNQDGHEHSRAVRAPRAALWGRMRKSSNRQPESSTFPVNMPTGQADPVKPHGVQRAYLDAASQKKELAGQAVDPLFAKGPPHTISKVFRGRPRNNKIHRASVRARMHALTPGGNATREYSTSVSIYETKSEQSGCTNDDSLRERPLEHDMSSNTENGHGLGHIQKVFSPDEAAPPAEIERSANTLTMPQFWTHSSQRSRSGQKPIVHYCRTLQSTEEAVQLFLGSEVIGFDMEWKAQASGWDSIQNNVSLIQIANEERIALFQIALFKPARSLEDLVSPSLKRLIESPDIMKVGVSIKADCTRLRKYLGIDARGIFELSHLFKLVKYGKDNPKLVNKRGVNLSDQVKEHFGLPLEKSDDVRCGDWSRALNYRQVQYAATDPYACICLFHTMEAKRLAIDPTPPRPAFAELNQPIVLPLGQKVVEEEKEPLI